MVRGQLSDVLAFVRRFGTAGADRDSPDADLLGRFIGTRDEAAFNELLYRHGPLVFGVCRSILGDTSDAADAFQATFLVLVHRARSISKRSSLSSWLYGVAYRVAVRARAGASRRQALPREGADMVAREPTLDPADAEIAAIVHEEVHNLPEKYRVPIVLCYVEGRTRGEAALELRCSEGAIKGRLERARDLLQRRLLRRGVALAAGLSAIALGGEAARAAVPAALVDATLRAAMLAAAGQAAAGGAISGPAAALTRHVLRAMTVTPRQIASVVLLVGLLGTFAGLVTHQGLGGAQAVAPPPVAHVAVADDEDDDDQPPPLPRPTPRAIPLPLPVHE
jgi:RNA polymerase sigma factor (sigma-70 family)